MEAGSFAYTIVEWEDASTHQTAVSYTTDPRYVGCLSLHHFTLKVALCRAYLRKECSKPQSDCPLSHDLDPDRTPECGMFLRGLCIDRDCRYLHVKKSQDAPDCEEFKSSYCPLGARCPKRHYFAPLSAEKKRQREESGEEEEVPDEDELLKRTWEETPSLKFYE